jgi:hypothetical protein
MGMLHARSGASSDTFDGNYDREKESRSCNPEKEDVHEEDSEYKIAVCILIKPIHSPA